MNSIERLWRWGDAHHPKWLDFVRIALGIFLLWKGIEFANNMNNLMAMMSNLPFGNLMMVILAHYALFSHMLGGILLTTGLLTRLACILQIPVLVAAVFTNLFNQFFELPLSVLVLLLLIYFLVIGSGRWSLDWYVNKEYVKRNLHEREIY